MKSLGIMQPYFLPYIGYFQLIDMVDEFVMYDNIQFTKKGWIHRNRMLQNGKDEYFTLPLKKDSDFLNVNERFISSDFEKEKKKILQRIESSYRKSLCFEAFFPVIKNILGYENMNLFEFIFHSINKINEYLDIQTPIVVSSSLPDYIKPLKSQEKVLAICKERKADVYINSSGGIDLYDHEFFRQQKIDLKFYKCNNISYSQFSQENFVSYLSILDICMFNEKETVKSFLKDYSFLNE